MLAATCELICDQGGYWDPTITLTDDNGDPVNLTGYTARMVVKATETSPTALVEITSAGGGITITPATGVLQPVLTSASKMAQKDGAKNAKVTIVDQHLEFSGEYED